MELKIELSDYFSESEIKEVIRQHISDHLKNKVEREADRLLSNTAYYASYPFLESVFTDEMKKIVKNKTVEILTNLTPYNLLQSSYWERGETEAMRHLKSAIRENTDVINSGIKNSLSKIDFDAKVDEDFSYRLKEAIMEKLTHSCEH